MLGHKVRQELFSNINPLGEYVRIGGERYRVIGVMDSKGQILGFDMDDIVYIPAARALEMFNPVKKLRMRYTTKVEMVKRNRSRNNMAYPYLLANAITGSS